MSATAAPVRVAGRERRFSASRSPITTALRLAASSRTRRTEQRELDKLVSLHLPQVRLIAKRMQKRLRGNAELDDMIGYGIIGLIKAAKCFDPSRGVLLKTYAEHRIRGAILDGLRDMNWLSRSACRKKVSYLQSLSQAESTVPASGSKAACLPLPGAKPDAKFPPAALQTPLLEIVCAGWDLEDLEEISEETGWRELTGRTAENPAALYEQRALASRLAQAVSRLPRRNREAIEMYYQRDLSMKEIAKILNLHESRISQLHTDALRHLRISLSECGNTANPIFKKCPASSLSLPEAEFQNIG